MFQPFEGVKVLDLTEGVAGPYATMILGDLGAEVIKIERPDGDWGRILGEVKDGFSSQYIALNRNKKNISLNIQEPEGQAIFKKIAKQSEIIITSFRPGVTEKYGIGYEDIKKINPEIIYGRISGYGYQGKYKNYTGVDTVIQANSGIMNHIGPRNGQPYRTGFPIVDHVAARDLVQGIQAAYIDTLKGKVIEGPIDVSLYATAAALQAQQWQDYLLNKQVPMRNGNMNPVISPAAVYETREGSFISITIVRDKQWIRFCEAIEKKELATNEKFLTNALRLKNRQELEEVIVQELKTRTLDEWISVFEKFDITHAPVLDMEQIYQSDYFDAIPTVDFYLKGNKVNAIGLPFVYNGELHRSNLEPPALRGEQTIEILSILDIEQGTIKRLIDKGVIAVAEEVIY
ncbi:CaiB/BaiF CoA transferase family protein [Oceanobacillus damuensis]|uniref:CaiB/BaiF CoA transferase family protein n=1 Tax=Oceanobacillus damuensis TaxID=937928 RepID=UPI000830E6A3|nr:CaiB/BaiF CoA-transferase family protein [Oceanobacillus damuensis]